jgi:hypothetical protein
MIKRRDAATCVATVPTVAFSRSVAAAAEGVLTNEGGAETC